jgi:guanylate kinase
MVVSGPSGSGKTSLCQAALDREADARFSVSYTTRPPRAGEREGVDYHFTDETAFRGMIAQKQFAEWAGVHGHLYGTSSAWLRSQMDLGVDVILDIDYQGAYQVRESFAGDALSSCSWSRLRGAPRLVSRRTESEARVAQRLRTAEEELRHVHLYDYVVVNDAFERAVGDLRAILAAERSRRARILPRIRRAYGPLIPETPPPPPSRKPPS